MKEMKGRCKTGRVQQSEDLWPQRCQLSPAWSRTQPSFEQQKGLAASSPRALYGESHLARAWGCAGASSLSPALPRQESHWERGKPHGKTRRIPAADGKGSGTEPSKVEQGGEGTRDQGRKRWGQSRERMAVPSSPGPDSIACGAAGVAPTWGHSSAGQQVVQRRSPFSPDSAAHG